MTAGVAAQAAALPCDRGEIRQRAGFEPADCAGPTCGARCEERGTGGGPRQPAGHQEGAIDAAASFGAAQQHVDLLTASGVRPAPFAVVEFLAAQGVGEVADLEFVEEDILIAGAGLTQMQAKKFKVKAGQQAA